MYSVCASHLSVVFQVVLAACTCMCGCTCVHDFAAICTSKMTQCWSTRGAYMCVCALVRSGDVMLWPACCGTWPPLYCVSSTLRGSTIPQAPAHNTHYSIPQTTTEQNSTTPGTKSTQSLTTRRGEKTLELKLIKHSNPSNPPRQQTKSIKKKKHINYSTIKLCYTT